MSLLDLHARLANTALYFMGIMGLWAIYRYFRRQGLDSSYGGALVIGEILLLGQALLGAAIWITGAGSLAGKSIHLLYGIVSLLVVPGIFFYTKGNEERRVMMVYGAALLFLVGILLRAITTGLRG